MKTKALRAAQIDALAQRLSETPIEPATSAKKAGDNLARLLAASICDERANPAIAIGARRTGTRSLRFSRKMVSSAPR